MLRILSRGHSGTSTVVPALLAGLAVAAALHAETARAGLILPSNCSIARVAFNSFPTHVDEICTTRSAGLGDDQTLDRQASNETSDGNLPFAALFEDLSGCDGASAPIRHEGASPLNCALICRAVDARDSVADCTNRVSQRSSVHPIQPAGLRLLDPPR